MRKKCSSDGEKKRDESGFLEASLVRQADGKLKNLVRNRQKNPVRLTRFF